MFSFGNHCYNGAIDTKMQFPISMLPKSLKSSVHSVKVWVQTDAESHFLYFSVQRITICNLGGGFLIHTFSLFQNTSTRVSSVKLKYEGLKHTLQLLIMLMNMTIIWMKRDKKQFGGISQREVLCATGCHWDCAISVSKESCSCSLSASDHLLEVSNLKILKLSTLPIHYFLKKLIDFFH